MNKETFFSTFILPNDSKFFVILSSCTGMIVTFEEDLKKKDKIIRETDINTVILV